MKEKEHIKAIAEALDIKIQHEKALEFINDMKNAIAIHLIKDIPSNNEWEVN